MAEGPGQRGDGQRARQDDKATYRVESHRVNDFLLGHVGQISYKPVDEEDADADIGDLFCSRITEQRECMNSLSRLSPQPPRLPSCLQFRSAVLPACFAIRRVHASD